MTEYCCGFLFDRGGGEGIGDGGEAGPWVLLISKRRPAWQAGRKNGIGGKLEPGESAREAMAREFLEETGLTVPEEAWEHFATIEGNGFRVSFLRAHGPHEGYRSITDEEVSRHQAWDLPREAIGNLRWLVPLALDRSLGTPTVFRHAGG